MSLMQCVITWPVHISLDVYLHVSAELLSFVGFTQNVQYPNAYRLPCGRFGGMWAQSECSSAEPSQTTNKFMPPQNQNPLTATRSVRSVIRPRVIQTVILSRPFQTFYQRAAAWTRRNGHSLASSRLTDPSPLCCHAVTPVWPYKWTDLSIDSLALSAVR